MLAAWARRALVLPLLLLASCGSQQTITMQADFVGQSLSLVISGDPGAITVARQRIAAASSNPGGPPVHVLDGDRHQGNQVCQTDASYQGHNYHVAVYSDLSSVSPNICGILALAG